MTNTQDLTLEVLKTMQKSIIALDQKISAQDLRFDAIDKRFDKIENKLDSVEHWVVHALGVATMAKSESTQALVIVNDLSTKLKKK